jgi:hypothetical protein
MLVDNIEKVSVKKFRVHYKVYILHYYFFFHDDVCLICLFSCMHFIISYLETFKALIYIL